MPGGDSYHPDVMESYLFDGSLCALRRLLLHCYGNLLFEGSLSALGCPCVADRMFKSNYQLGAVTHLGCFYDNHCADRNVAGTLGWA